MKTAISEFLNKYRRQTLESKPTPTGIPEMDAAIQAQVKHVKEQYPERFAKELEYVKRNAEFIASDYVMDRLEIEHEGKISEEASKLEHRRVSDNAPNTPKQFDGFRNDMHAKKSQQIKKGRELDIGD